MTADQCREARRLLGLTQSRLSRLAGIPRNVVSQLEVTGRTPVPLYGSLDRLAAIRAAFVKEGVEFTSCNPLGVRLRSQSP